MGKTYFEIKTATLDAIHAFGARIVEDTESHLQDLFAECRFSGELKDLLTESCQGVFIDRRLAYAFLAAYPDSAESAMTELLADMDGYSPEDHATLALQIHIEDVSDVYAQISAEFEAYNRVDETKTVSLRVGSGAFALLQSSGPDTHSIGNSDSVLEHPQFESKVEDI